MAKSAVHLVNAALLAGLFAGSVLVFDTLPERIPMHFGWDGTPDRFAQTTWLSWLALPLIALATAALCYGCAWLIAQAPEAVNVPGCQAEYDALSSAGKQQIGTLGQRFLYWTAAGTTVLFAVIQRGSYAVATGTSEQLPSYAGVWVAVVFTLAVIAGAVWIGRKTRAEVKRLYRQEQDAPPAEP